MQTPDISLQYINIFVGTLPGQRYDYYANSNFDKVYHDVLSELNKIDEALGFYPLASHPKLLQYLYQYNFAVLFLGLIFDILLIIFVVVAIMLVFSLLLISVETKAFEFGVMRLVGLTKQGFVAMVLTQAIMFVLPAVILAFIFSFPIIYWLYATIMGDVLGYMPSIFPSGMATFNALFIGIIIPICSSIVPIKRGLSANLNETLNATRSRTKGALISIIDNKVLNIVPYLLYGFVAVCFGIIVYYGLPLALLKLNFGLILTIFFILLLGILFGLVLISSNF